MFNKVRLLCTHLNWQIGYKLILDPPQAEGKGARAERKQVQSRVWFYLIIDHARLSFCLLWLVQHQLRTSVQQNSHNMRSIM